MKRWALAAVLAAITTGLAIAGSVLAGEARTTQVGLDASTFTGPPKGGDEPQLGEPTPVADNDGNLIRCPDGELLLVPYGDGPPAGVAKHQRLSPEEAAAEIGPGAELVKTVDPAVARCGPKGGGADGTPIWVPASEGKQDVVAPSKYVREQTR